MTPIQIMERLKAANISFTVTTVRDSALMFQAAVPGQRWEIEVFEDGHVEIERFVSTGDVADVDEATLAALFRENSE